MPLEQIQRVANDYGKAGSQTISWVGGGPVMQVRGAYASMICHCLNGITGACDNVGGTLVNNKEYTVGFPSFEEFLDETAKKGSKMGKIDHRGRKDFPCITSGKPGSSVVTNRAADGILNADPYDIKVAILS
jgi:anaerobic selenocysteine-containing dehydrogenase